MKRKILLVEDNEGDQLLVEEAFIEFNAEYEIAMAFSGEEALNKLQSDKFDIVIVDTLLPGMDGFETCQKIKESFNNLKVVIFTGVIDAVDAGRARAAGADDYCVKSRDCEGLVSAVRSLYENTDS